MTDEQTEKESGELAPGGVEHVGGDGVMPAAGEADEMRIAMLAWKRSVKSIVRIKLDEAYFATMKTIWAQPMRWIAVCRRPLEHIGRKAGSNRLQLVAVRVRLGLLNVEKFLFERVAFFNYSLMLLDEAKFRRLMFKQFLLDVKQGHVGLGAVRHAHGYLQALKECLECVYDVLRSRDDLNWI